MAQLNHKGPEDNGPETGRKLGLCPNNAYEEPGEIGKGHGQRKHSGRGTGIVKRLKSNKHKSLI